MKRKLKQDKGAQRDKTSIVLEKELGKVLLANKNPMEVRDCAVWTDFRAAAPQAGGAVGTKAPQREHAGCV